MYLFIYWSKFIVMSCKTKLTFLWTNLLFIISETYINNLSVVNKPVTGLVYDANPKIWFFWHSLFLSIKFCLLLFHNMWVNISNCLLQLLDTWRFHKFIVLRLCCHNFQCVMSGYCTSLLIVILIWHIKKLRCTKVYKTFRFSLCNNFILAISLKLICIVWWKFSFSLPIVNIMHIV